MQNLIPDLYSYIGDFLDDISLLNFVMSCKNINKYTASYRNKRISKDQISNIKKFITLNEIGFVMEICFGPDLPTDRIDILNNLNRNYGINAILVYATNKHNEIHFKSHFNNKYLTHFYRHEKKEEDWKNGALVINPKEGKITDILLRFTIINNKNLVMGYCTYNDIFQKRYYIQCESIEEESYYLSQDGNQSWEKMGRHEKITNRFPLNNYIDIYLTYFIGDKKIYLLEYTIVVTDPIRFKKLCWTLYHKN